MNTTTYKPAYANCVLLNFEDHNYYDDSDSWTVYYDGNKKEIVEEYWTTRGACFGCNANPKDIQYGIDDCPAELMAEVVELLRKDVAEHLDIEKMAQNAYEPKYKYQEASAKQCQAEFMAAAPAIIAELDDIWQLIYLSDMVHKGSDFIYRYSKRKVSQPLRQSIMNKVVTKMVPVRKRAKAVYGQQYNGIVTSVRNVKGGYYSDDYTAITVDVEGLKKPVYLKLYSGGSAYNVDDRISFAGYFADKEEYKYIFVNKCRIIAEDDILSWH